jgi:hypothetical protein
MTSKFAIDPAKLTTVLTSCGRFDLLKQTVASFLEHFAPDKIIIGEDSERGEDAAAFANAFPIVDMRVNGSKIGQMRSIDALYATLNTPYVLHLEDDWKFIGGVDLQSIMDFLDVRPDISVVSIGYRFDRRFRRSARRTTHAGIGYWVWDLDAHPKWFSYSFNPSIGRVGLWKEFGPFAPFVTEEALSEFCKRQGMRIAMVIPSVAHHIGTDRHAHDHFQPTRAKTLSARFKRSLAKRWAQIQGRHTS